ncbi:helix-turn-helix domain-containing protein [Pyramidobacter piscolens]|uniref:helix-turn-helix domain-containing protein n=1 Tax=Pyramidobacter piscolens TaxID=638849 RepID=UPI002AB06562|nr:helix-turn-helix transcriptional regulator [Pyramidobacter piscolens]
MLDTKRVFSLRLRKARQAADMTQRETAEALNIGVRRYQDLEAGRSLPVLGGIMNIADLFDLSTDYLLGRTNHI